MGASETDQRLFIEQQRLLYINSTGSTLLSMVFAAFLCWYIRDSAKPSMLFLWFAVFCIIALCRFGLVVVAKRSANTFCQVKRLDRFFVGGIWLSALCWGTASFLFLSDVSPVNQTVFTIVITGISAGAISFLCSNWPAIAGFLFLTLLPLAANFFMMQGDNSVILAILILLYLVVCLTGGQKLHRNMSENILLSLKSTENEKVLQVGQERYQHIFNHSPLGIVHYDASGTIVDCNEIFAGVLGISRVLLIGRNMLSVLQNNTLSAAIEESLRTGSGYFEGEYTAESNGRTTPVRIFLKATRSDDSTIIGGIGTLEDFTERKSFEQKIHHQASFDSLTGLPNRRQLLLQLAQELSRASRHQQYGALLMMDLDNFKTINDSLGHGAGDAVLKQVAHRLKNTLRKEDSTARMGGDEFVVLLPHLGKNIELAAQRAQDIAKKLTTALASPFAFANRELNITLSIGISLYPEQQNGAGDILKQADTAMNQAKTAGRNTIRFFLPSMQQAADTRLQMSNDLKKAIENDNFLVHFQPQVKADGTIVGAEGLLRWKHPDRGMILPGDFIGVAEETGIIVQIGMMVLDKICRTIKTWEVDHLLGENQTIAVNISAREFSSPDFVERVIAILEKTGINPQHLDIELTEGSLISSVSDTIDKIHALRQYGIKFSVDDFGTGYSSLSYLKSLPLHTLKLDRSFVNGISPTGNEVTLVEMIITMARNLGLEIVAEGVETVEELNYLGQKGCHIYQGYYFSKPIPTAEFGKLLKKGGVGRQDLGNQNPR